MDVERRGDGPPKRNRRLAEVVSVRGKRLEGLFGLQRDVSFESQRFNLGQVSETVC